MLLCSLWARSLSYLYFGNWTEQYTLFLIFSSSFNRIIRSDSHIVWSS